MTKIKAKIAKPNKARKTQKITPTTKVVKPVKKAVKKEELDTKNIKKTVEKIVESRRQVLYNYPDDVKEPLDRKSWRQKVRNELKNLELQLSRAEGKAHAEVKRKYIAYRKEVLLVP